MCGERLGQNSECVFVSSFKYKVDDVKKVVVVPCLAVRPNFCKGFIVPDFNSKFGSEKVVVSWVFGQFLSAEKSDRLAKSVRGAVERVLDDFVLVVRDRKKEGVPVFRVQGLAVDGEAL